MFPMLRRETARYPKASFALLLPPTHHQRMENLAGRHAVLTGASRGLGVHMARALAAEGLVLTLAARSVTELAAVRDEIDGKCIAVPCDVADADQRAHLVQHAEAELGPIDILVNNAGVEFASFYSTQDLAEIEHTISVNLLAPMLLTRDVLPAMVRRGQGHVVNIASAAGKSGTPFEVAYSASKFGLVGFTQALRSELRGSGVGCSVLCPGFVADDGMWARFAEQGLTSNRILGVSTPANVTAALLTSIRKDRAEIVVNPTPLRPLLALEAIAPGLHPWFMELMGVTKLFRRGAALRASG